MRLALLLLCLPLAASAQVRTSDAPTVGSFGAAAGYAFDAGRVGPAFGGEVAVRSLAVSASVSLPTNEIGAAFSGSVSAFPGGRAEPVAVAVGVEFAYAKGRQGSGLGVVGPAALVSYRLVHTPKTSVVPEVQAAFLIPVGTGANTGAQVGASARLLLASATGVGTRLYTAPSVSRVASVDGSTDAVYALGFEAGFSFDL